MPQRFKLTWLYLTFNYLKLNHLLSSSFLSVFYFYFCTIIHAILKIYLLSLLISYPTKSVLSFVSNIFFAQLISSSLLHVECAHWSILFLVVIINLLLIQLAYLVIIAIIAYNGINLQPFWSVVVTKDRNRIKNKMFWNWNIMISITATDTTPFDIFLVLSITVEKYTNFSSNSILFQFQYLFFVTVMLECSILSFQPTSLFERSIIYFALVGISIWSNIMYLMSQ